MFFQLFRNLIFFFFKAVPREQGTRHSLHPPSQPSGCPKPLPYSAAGQGERIIYLVAASLRGGDSKCHYLCLAQAESS